MTKYHLTFDIDWAPDWSVREVLDLLEQYSAQATFFFTHDSPTIREIADAGHTVGIHPNFMPASTQGQTPIEIVGNLLDLWPKTRVMRTHGLYQGTLLFQGVAKEFPQLEFDLSILTYGFPHSGWFEWRMPGARMRRLNYTWEDDVAFEHPEQDWKRFEPLGPLSVLDFHPIHVSLNSNTTVPYDSVKMSLGSRPLTEADREFVAVNRSKDAGTFDYLRAVLESESQPLSFEELLCV